MLIALKAASKHRKGGANRVELCMGIPEGGTTPSYGEIKNGERSVEGNTSTCHHPQPWGDFLYTKQELQRMAMDIGPLP